MSEASDLRSLLRAADQNRQSVGEFTGRIQDRSSLHELASLIETIEEEGDRSKQKTTNIHTRVSSTAASYAEGIESRYGSVRADGNARGGTRYGEDRPTITREDLISDSDFDYDTSPPEPPKTGEVDEPDHIVLRFQTNYLIRGKHGKYLTAYSDDSSPGLSNANVPNTATGADTKHSGGQTKVYLLGTEGLGVGDAADGVSFINVENKDDTSPIKFGQVVAIKSFFAKERLLGLRDGVKLGFWRHLIGQGEKWQVLKAHSPSSAPNPHLGGEDVSARGKFVRIGDVILLQTHKSDHILSIYEKEARLIYRERTSSIAQELWQVELFASVPLPLWALQRPYLSHKYFLLPPSSRFPAPEVENRAFPRNVTGSFLDPPSPAPTPLINLSLEVQQCILMREILLLFMGIEGSYIRVASPTSSTQSMNPPSGSAHPATQPTFRSGYPYPPSTAPSNPTLQSNTPAPTLKAVKLVMDMDSADRSIALKISSLFPMCECMLHIRGFVSRQTRYEYGLCSHALVSELQVILKDFYVLVAQLEYLLNQNKLTLQKFVYLLYPSSKVLFVLDVLCKEISEKVGGELVNCLYTLYLHQGDPETKVLYQRLLEKAVVPYIHMISSWVFRGELVDNYHEFLLVEDRSIDKEALLEDYNASYWDNKYTLQPKHVVAFLQSYANKILICGKYLHIVRDCLGDALMLSDMQSGGGKKVLLIGDSSAADDKAVMVSETLKLPAEKEITLDLTNHHASIFSAVDYAYSISSRTLLSILIHKYSLYKHLASLHKYFLLKQGDFFIQFMDISETELKKDVKEIRLNKLQSLLYMAIQSSTLMHDDHKEKLTCTLASHNLIQHLHLIQIAGEYPGNAFSSAGVENIYTNTMAGLKGIEAFTLDYLVTFPLSIVLSRRVITKYQLLSRLLYFSKHVERRVLSCWMFQQSTRDCVHVRGVMGAAYTLRHRMLHFMQNFVYYITFEVINPHEHQLSEDLKQANDMDQVMALHEKFLDICLKECLLASQDLLKVLTKLMTTCLLFSDHMTRFMTEATTAAEASQELTVAQAERPASTRLNRQSSSFRKSPVHGSSNRDLKEVNDKDDPKDLAMQKVALKLDSILSRRKQRIEKKTDFIAREAGHEAFVRIMNKFSETFDSQLKEFLDTLWNNSYRHHAQLANLCVRLDYNGFYSSKFAPPY